MNEELIRLFEERFHEHPEIEAINGGGSSRKYYRLRSKKESVIGVYNSDVFENEVFLKLDGCLEDQGINVPHIIDVSKDGRCILQQDLGDELLFDLLGKGNGMEYSKMALEKLIKIQTLPEKLWKDKVGYPPFSERLVRWDLNYFKYDFLKPSGVIFDEEKLEDDFDRISEALISPNIRTGLMYRDFQSRNIILNHGELWFIDFQGARKGPMAYDAVSYIWQAKAPFSYPEREELCRYYLEKVNDTESGIKELENQLHIMEVFRTLQVLGAYGFRGLIERKTHFLESIPYGVANLAYLKEKGRLDEYPEIGKVSVALEKRYSNSKSFEKEGLTIKVYSFSYKKGYPEDNSGNGGGFMFDCRGMHNPGRYQEFKSLTGKDKEVIAFLEKSDEAKNFVENAMKTVIPSIETYIKRGFTSLQIGFGCTGGQHRSVYCAERFSSLVKERFPEVKLQLIHREQAQK